MTTCIFSATQVVLHFLICDKSVNLQTSRTEPSGLMHLTASLFPNFQKLEEDEKIFRRESPPPQPRDQVSTYAKVLQV